MRVQNKYDGLVISEQRVLRTTKGEQYRMDKSCEITAQRIGKISTPLQWVVTEQNRGSFKRKYENMLNAEQWKKMDEEWISQSHSPDSSYLFVTPIKLRFPKLLICLLNVNV